jgi:NTE family protein
MVKIGTDHFWDGGIVSNTPLQHLLDQDDCVNTLVFQVDLFSARGALPRDIQDVMARHKDIVYSSRTRYNTDVYRRIHTWKTRLRDTLQKVPADRLTDEERRLKDELADLPEIAILQLIYQQKSYEGHARDYEFSGTSMREHWTSGYEDTMRTLKHRQLDRDAAEKRRDRRPRRAPGRVTGTVSEAAATSSPAFRQSTS